VQKKNAAVKCGVTGERAVESGTVEKNTNRRKVISGGEQELGGYCRPRGTDISVRIRKCADRESVRKGAKNL